MAVLDMFDKLDDIVYKPIETICEWVQEPLRQFETGREIRKLKAERKAITDEKRENIKIDVEARKWHAEVDKMIAENEDERRDKLVAALKSYQLDLANASKDIAESIGQMSLDLRERAYDLVYEKTQQYLTMQEEAQEKSMKELERVTNMFAERSPETYAKLVDVILNERTSAVNRADDFIKELAVDMNRLCGNVDDTFRKTMERTGKFLDPLANALQMRNSLNINPSANSLQIENSTNLQLPKKDD